MTPVILWIATVLALASMAPAQESVKSEPYVWKNVTVGAGGFIPGIVFSRAERGLAYLRSDMGGCYRWDDGSKRWIPLQDGMAESSYFGGESIAPHPTDPNVVYVAAGMYRTEPAAILRSHDRGRTWQVFPVAFHMGGNEDGRGVGERLAIDPNLPDILYFASREDGLQRSTDRGEHWQRVENFPLHGLGPSPRGRPMHTGLSFVVFDPRSGSTGVASQSILVGNADPGDHHLFRSDDAGQSWKAVPGEPKRELLPLKAEIGDDGILYITYGNGAGPNGVTDGAAFKLDTRSSEWTDITPDKRPDRPKGGYCGISLDRQHPGTLAVTTLNRWGPVDTVWRSTDGGSTWNDIVEKSTRDVTATPFLLWGQPKAKLGWWMAAFAIDPFDSDHAVYATGATVYATNDFSNVNKDQPTHWRPWVAGIEQTAIITLMSPIAGPHLLSGFGDIGGFVHEDLDVSPPQGMYANPMFGNTNTLDYAELKPNVIVRSGRPHEGQAALGFSEDGGRTWQPLAVSPSQAEGRRRGADPAIIVSADGGTFMVVSRPTPGISRDGGKSWTPVKGLPANARPIADRTDAQKFYALDFDGGAFFVSIDGGATFSRAESSGLPDDIKPDEPTWHEAAWPLMATPTKTGDLWLVSKTGLFHSMDAGKSFAKVPSDLHVEVLGFGKAAAGRSDPALFAIGTMHGLKAIWRSDYSGRDWVRINDEQHQYGTRFRCITGDPRVFGRAYVGTDGRGVLYADPQQ